MVRTGKKINNKASKGKGKLWKKGQSSSHNPEYNKHRQAAKKRAYFGNEGSNKLTIAQLEQHNRMTMNNRVENVDDTMSIGGVTGITGVTNCSLLTFSRLLQNWNSGSIVHVKMRAALEAVAEVIKSTGEEESETKYFSILVVMLDDVDSDETLTAIVSLLSMVVKKMSKSTLLGLQRTNVLETFTKLLIKYMNSDHCILLRNLLSIVYAFLKPKMVWPDKSDEINVILEFITHHKPKVRRVARFIICNLLLNYAAENSNPHPQAVPIANYCEKKLKNKSFDSKEVFYILNLLQEIIGLFPEGNIKLTCETIIRGMTLSNTLVTSNCLKALRGVFQVQSTNNLSKELNAKIISAMYPHQPNTKESQSLIEWLQLMEAALTHLYRLDEEMCIKHLPKFFGEAVKCWLGEREDVAQAVAITLSNLLHACIQRDSEVFQNSLLKDSVDNPLHKMFRHVEGALKYQYQKSWKYVIFVLGGFFEVMGKDCQTVMKECLRSLADLHDTFKFPHISEVEKALGIAIEQMGPHIVLSAIPLQIDEEKPNFPRSWLLPLLRDHIKNTQLGFFCKNFIGLAKKMKERAIKAEQEHRTVESKLYEVIFTQIWALLPGFCTEPTDFEKIFTEEIPGRKGFPRILAEVLKFEPTLRLTVLSAIRILITKNMENEKHIETMSKFANNYLLVFFNLYAPESKDAVDDKVRLATYETIKIYLQITKREVCESLFTKAMEKLTSETDIFKKTTLIDITKAILPYVNEELISQLYEHAKPLLKHSNHTLQKKAFGVIKEICSCKSEFCQHFIENRREDLLNLLNEPVTALPPATKALRLNCLQSMVSQLTVHEREGMETNMPEAASPTKENLWLNCFESMVSQLTDAEIKCLEAVIPEAALSTKENSVKARTAAYNLLVEIGHVLKKLNRSDNKVALGYYISVLTAGIINASPRMISATVLAIGRVLYEFKDDIASNLIDDIITTMCSLMKSPCREVVVSALSLLKVIFATVETLTLQQHVEKLVESVTSMSEGNQRHFKFNAKEIFRRLIRKFGYEMISKLVPEKYHKQLTNIRKVEARRERRKGMKNYDSDDEENKLDKKSNDFEAILADSDDEMEQGMKLMRKEPKRKHMKKSYLEEDDEDDIVDFMDPSVNKKITTMPTKDPPAVTKPISAFPVSEDGRIIIEDEEAKPKKNKTEEKEKISYQDLLKSKRKHEESDDEQDEPNANSSNVKKGIHRTLQPKPKRKCFGEEFKAKKAGGDIKKGKLEPYAYVPFNKQSLNKRKQVKLKGQFKNIVKSAKRGASIGMKRKARNSKKGKNTM